VDEMLRVVKPDVVHITTPPRSHCAIGRQCLAAGSHVYVEKPFGMTAVEAISLIEQASERSLRITAGHNYQFTLEMLELRRLVHEGFVGGKPVHLESYWSYDLGGSAYATAFLGNPNHWLRQLPGQLFHNIISHGIAKLAEFLDDELVEIFATAHQGREVAQLGPDVVLDELRVAIKDKRNTTAFFVFTTSVKGLNLLRVHGPAGSLSADIIAGTIIRNRRRPCKSYLTYVIPPLTQAREYLRNTAANVMNFLRRRLYQDFGMKELIERFYDSIRRGSPPPIPYREIILTARIMDEIFAQIYSDRGQRTEEGGLRRASVHSSPVTHHVSLSQSE
jgi:predicted dehydrogenase